MYKHLFNVSNLLDQQCLRLMFSQHKNMKKLFEAEEELNKLRQWFQGNKLSLNCGKKK